MTPLPACGLYAITPPSGRMEADPEILAQKVEAAIDGGAAMIQYRAKESAQEGAQGRAQEQAQKQAKNSRRTFDIRNERHLAARCLASLCRKRKIPLIINDDPLLASEVDADGVHIGRDDGSLFEARRHLGDDRIIGVSCYNRLDLALRAADEGASYVAFGSFFPSSTKTGTLSAPISLLSLARERLDLPIVAIGGITCERGARLIDAGASFIAAIAGVFAKEAGENDIDEERGILASSRLDAIEQAARGYARLFPSPGGPPSKD